MQCCILVNINFLFPFCIHTYTVTRGFITDLNLKAGSTFIEIKWSRPPIQPIHYSVSTSCKATWTNSANTIKSEEVPGDRKSTVVTGLYPRSKCEVKFIAVYNPASLDTGIFRTVSTKKAGRRKFLFVIQTLISINCNNILTKHMLKYIPTYI